MYLIHGVDVAREQRMIKEFEDGGIDISGVQWIRHPNKDELNREFIDRIVSWLPHHLNPWEYRPDFIPKGIVSCTYKHYLGLKDIVENKYEYGIIMEDNLEFVKGVNVNDRINTYISQLNSKYPDWDILFDYDYGFNANDTVPTEPYVYVYPRATTFSGNKWLGGAKMARFYIVKYNSAVKLYNNYLPFNCAPDMWMNFLFRKLNMKVFWAEPSIVRPWKHDSTAYNS